MKVSSISSSYLRSVSVYKQPQFKGNLLQNAKRGLIPLVLASGMFIANPAKAESDMRNFDESETVIPAGETSMNFVKCLVAACFLTFGAVKVYELFHSDDKNKTI